jgi:hypothetical protein
MGGFGENGGILGLKGIGAPSKMEWDSALSSVDAVIERKEEGSSAARSGV